MPGRSHLLLACGLLATAAVARADVTSAADRWFSDANVAMDRHQPRIAAAAYRAAWRLEPRAKVALDLGVALAELGDVAAAAQAFEVYVADPASDPAKRPVIERQLDAWRPRLGRIAIQTVPADATIAIDGARPLRGDGTTNVPALPGKHRIAIERAGYERRELDVVVVAQQTVEAHEQLVALAPVPAPREHDRLRTAMWVAAGTAGVAGIVGVTAGVVAVERWNTVHVHCPGGVCASPSDLALADRARHAGYLADGAFAASGLALVGAAVLWQLSPRHAGVAIAPTSHGAMVGWQLAY